MKKNKLLQYFFHQGSTCDGRKDPTEWSVEKQMTAWMTVGLPFAAAFALWFYFQIPVESMGEITCPLRLNHNMYCPACGGTRAFVSLLHGRLWDSIRYNPVVAVSCAQLVLFYIPNVIFYIEKWYERKISAGNEKTEGHRGRKVFLYGYGVKYHVWYLLIPLLAAGINFVVKNYYLLAKGIALIP